VVWPQLPVADTLVGQLKPDSGAKDLDELIVETKNIMGKITQHLVDVATKLIRLAIVPLLILVSFAEPRSALCVILLVIALREPGELSRHIARTLN
jgi:hypothetical protein